MASLRFFLSDYILISIIKMICEEIWEVKRKLQGRERMDLEDEDVFSAVAVQFNKVLSNFRIYY